MSVFQGSIPKNAPHWRYIPDVEYRKYGEISRKLQIITPWVAEKPLPLIVYLPGSAFYQQEMYADLPGLSRLAEQGYVVAALQYRQSQLAKFPAQIQDVHNAVTFLKESAAAFHIDPDNIFLMGHSSGGYNALMAALTVGLAEFDGGANHRFRAVSAVSAPCCLKMEMGMTVPGKISYDPQDFRPELDMLGLQRFEDDPPLCRKARPDSYIRRADLPILLIHGDRDGTVHIDNSRKFYASLKEQGKQTALYELPDQDHGGSWLWDRQVLQITDEFFRRCIP